LAARATNTIAPRWSGCRRRNVAFIKGDAPVIVIYDDLVAAQPSTFQFMLHALKAFEVDDKAAQLTVEQPKAGVTVRYLSPAPLAFRQWDGFEPKPKKPFPNQWHVEAGTQEKRDAIGMLTVIVPYRAGQRADWKAERLETSTALGVRVTRGGKTTLIGFNKTAAGTQATLAGASFDGPVLVR